MTSPPPSRALPSLQPGARTKQLPDGRCLVKQNGRVVLKTPEQPKPERPRWFRIVWLVMPDGSLGDFCLAARNDLIRDPNLTVLGERAGLTKRPIGAYSQVYP